jgi:hypothetical protein
MESIGGSGTFTTVPHFTAQSLEMTREHGAIYPAHIHGQAFPRRPHDGVASPVSGSRRRKRRKRCRDKNKADMGCKKVPVPVEFIDENSLLNQSVVQWNQTTREASRDGVVGVLLHPNMRSIQRFVEK